MRVLGVIGDRGVLAGNICFGRWRGWVSYASIVICVLFYDVRGLVYAICGRFVQRIRRCICFFYRYMSKKGGSIIKKFCKIKSFSYLCAPAKCGIRITTSLTKLKHSGFIKLQDYLGYGRGRYQGLVCHRCHERGTGTPCFADR